MVNLSDHMLSIENGRQNLVMREPLNLHCPVRLMQGTDDTAVTRETALKLFDHIDADDLSLYFKRGADHSFSDQECLKIIEKKYRSYAGIKLIFLIILTCVLIALLFGKRELID